MSVKSFFIRLFIFLIPAVLVVVLYLITDPFKVLYHYNIYYGDGQDIFATLDKDYVSTEMFINNNPSHHYDSFIFGNSRSIAYKVSTWNTYTHSDKSFHFDASAESLYSLHKKIKFLSENGVKIKNSLLVVDNSLLGAVTNTEGILYLPHPIVSRQNKLLFQMEFFKAFLDYKFLISFIDFKLTHHRERFFKDIAIDRLPLQEPGTNELTFPEIDSLIINDSATYYQMHKDVFFKRDSIEHYSPQVIREKQKQMLTEIHDIFVKDSTNYRIVISPLYFQDKLNHEDLTYLQSLFGVKNVYDFSGINDITNDIHNYYEKSHYRPHVADYIMDSIYRHGN